MMNFGDIIGINKVFNLLRLFKGAFGKYKLELIVIVLLGLVSSFFEGVGISAVIPIFSFVAGQGGQATDFITKFIESSFNFFGIVYTFRTLIFLVGFLFVVRIFALFLVQYITARIVFGYERNMRNDLFRSTVSAKWPFLVNQKVGHLDQLLITNTTNVSQFFGFFATLIIISTKTIVYTFIAINVSLPVAILTLFVGLLAFIFFQPLFTKNKLISGEAEEQNRAIAHFTSQHVGGMKAIKIMSIEDEVAEKASTFFEKIRNLYVNMTIVRGSTEMLIKIVGLAFVGGVFVFMYKSPGFNFAAFAVVVYAINQIFSQIQAAQTQFHAVSAMVPYLDRSVSYMNDSRRMIEDKSGAPNFSFEDKIELKDLSFSYPQRGEVISKINLSIGKGEMIGIIGPSGSGKTTVIDLLLRLYSPTSGLIMVDGKDVREIDLKKWRDYIGYVSQDIFILNDTIKNNIFFYDQDITDEDVVASSKLVNIHDFIMSLPKQYDTVIGDRGVLLSGGQRQRIILARILARKPKLLILDEATSSLDGESEAVIKEAIDELRGKTTILIVAHRLSTISSVDKLVVLEAGTITEVGRPDVLLKNKDSYFYRLNNLT
jgi:ABC-type multidrug transport system fused ATPase/permease subunit